MGFLTDITKQKRREIDELKKSSSFMEALSGESIHLICEIKKASPSRGMIKDVSAREMAKIYEEAGADAISVLTESNFFRGSIEDLKAAAEVTKIPVLRKDFILDKVQVYESKIFGASSFLLITSCLEVSTLKELIDVGRELGMEPLVEVGSEKDIEKALKAGAKIIGINSRDLETLKVDKTRFEKLAPLIPNDRIKVAESGISSRDEIRKLVEIGINCFLIGEALMSADDPVQLINDLK